MKGQAIVAVLTVFAGAPAFSQQTYVPRYDFNAGYTFLSSPHVGLFENGFNLQAGVYPSTWFVVGFDYTNTRGDSTLTPNLLPASLQQELAAVLAQLAAQGLVPPGFMLAVPTHSFTQTFALGPNLTFRHFRRFTFFVRPSLGAVRETATPRPHDPITAAVVQFLVPAGKKTDWTGFYGFGGGADLILTHHFAIRVQSDLVYDHLFNDILKDGRWTVRFSVGPVFRFGPNIVH
jgi:hypothetical protein